MASRRWIAWVLVVAGALVFLITPADEIITQSVREVFVVNFPEIQKVAGTVVVDGAVHLAEMRAVRSVIVAPVLPTETTRLVDAGVLVTDGFPSVVLSLHGSVRGTVQKRGEVGAFLVPDEESIQLALNEQGMMHFPLEAQALGVSALTPYFASTQQRFNVAFPKYRVLMYNTTDKTVSVDLYAYLTN